MGALKRTTGAPAAELGKKPISGDVPTKPRQQKKTIENVDPKSLEVQSTLRLEANIQSPIVGESTTVKNYQLQSS